MAVNYIDIAGLGIFKTKQDAYNLTRFASLSGGKVTAEQLPSFVDDVIEGYTSVSEGVVTFYSDAEKTQLITGEVGKIYVDLAATIDGSYRYTGSRFAAIGTAVSTADKAINDANGNAIIETYATKDELGTASTTPATKSSLGVVQVGENINVDNGAISVYTATDSDLGVVKIGSNIDLDNGTISVKIGSTNERGLLQVGQNISVANGIISVATATDSDIGLAKAGSNINVDSAGTFSVNTGSKAQSGVLKVGDNLDVSDGTVSVKVASSLEKGIVQVGSNISIADGVISVATATSSEIGLAKAGSNINVDNAGTFSVNTASAVQSGVVQVGSNISVNDGTISLSSANVTAALGYTPLDAASISAVPVAEIEALFTNS